MSASPSFSNEVSGDQVDVVILDILSLASPPARLGVLMLVPFNAVTKAQWYWDTGAGSPWPSSFKLVPQGPSPSPGDYKLFTYTDNAFSNTGGSLPSAPSGWTRYYLSQGGSVVGVMDTPAQGQTSQNWYHLGSSSSFSITSLATALTFSTSGSAPNGTWYEASDP